MMERQKHQSDTAQMCLNHLNNANLCGNLQGKHRESIKVADYNIWSKGLESEWSDTAEQIYRRNLRRETNIAANAYKE